MAPDAAEQRSAQEELRVTQSIINLGLLSHEQMGELLAEQARMRESGQDVSLRQLCLRNRLISLDQFADAVRNSGVQPPAAGSVGTHTETTCVVYPGDDDATVRLPGGAVPDIGDMRRPIPRRLGRYEIMGEIGRGGMAIIYGAVDPGINRPVALKVLKEGQFATDEEVRRLQREASAAGKLRHPNIVQVHDFGVCDGRAYITMDLIEGESLDAIMRNRPVEMRTLLEILQKSARAIHYAHEQGVIHRDIKPANIIVDRNMEPHISDFGIAKAMDADTLHTRTGSLVGTPFYMSPEHAEGDLKLMSRRSDIFSLGVVLYEILTGAVPFRGNSLFETCRKIVEEVPLPPRALRRQTPRDIETVCLKALEKHPDNRYASAADFADDVGRFLAGEPVSASPPSLLRKSRGFAKKHKVLCAVLVTCVLIAAIVMGLTRYRVSYQVGKALKHADGLAADGKYAEARTEYLKIIGLDPENAEAHAKALRVERMLQQAELSQLISAANDCLARMEYRTALDLARKAAGLSKELSARTDECENVMTRANGTGTLGISALADGWSAVIVPANTPGPQTEPDGSSFKSEPFTISVPAGQYFVTMRKPGCTDMRFPVRLDRQPDGRGETLKLDLRLDVPPDMVFVPAGSVESMAGTTIGVGGGAALPSTMVSVEAFFMDRNEVTCAEYKAFLDALPENKRWKHLPVTQFPGGTYMVPAWPDGDCPEGMELKPVTGVGYESAVAYARWCGKRLPTEEEWEKAARGVDRRTYVWGNDAGDRLAEMRTAPLRQVGSSAADVSVHGVNDMCSNAAEWVWNPGAEDSPAPIAPRTRGGYAGAKEDAAFRADRISSAPFDRCGIRCVRSAVTTTDAADRERLSALAKSPFFGMRMEALAILAERHRELARPDLISALADPEPEVRHVAVMGLITISDEEVTGLAQNPNPLLMIEIAETEAEAGRSGGHDFLHACVRSEGSKLPAAMALGDLGCAQGLSALLEVKGFGQPEEASRAWKRVERIITEDPESAAVLTAMLRQPEDVQTDWISLILAASLLQKFPGDETIDVLADNLKNSGSNYVRRAAAQSLSVIGGERAVAALESAAAEDRAAIVAQAAKVGLLRLKHHRNLKPLPRAVDISRWEFQGLENHGEWDLQKGEIVGHADADEQSYALWLAITPSLDPGRLVDPPSYIVSFEVCIGRGALSVLFGTRTAEWLTLQNIGQSFDMEPSKWYEVTCCVFDQSVLAVCEGSEAKSLHVFSESDMHNMGFVVNPDSDVRIRNVLVRLVDR